MQYRTLGATGEKVSLLGLGGWHIGQDSLPEKESLGIIRAAIDGGVNFLDNAREYHAGQSEERMGKALRDGYRDRVFLMTKNCGHSRNFEDSMKSLEASLKALRTDRIDLWMFHEVVYDNDPEWIFTRGGIEAAIRAKADGKVRYIGFTGHKHPNIHLDMLRRDFPWDAVLMPLNVMDAHFRSFEKNVLPELVRRKIGVLAMKTLGGTKSELHQAAGLTARQCHRYVMSLPIGVLVSGMDSMEQLEENLQTACDFQPLSEAERHDILSRAAPLAGDGRYERFKTTEEQEGAPGRCAHDYECAPESQRILKP